MVGVRGGWTRVVIVPTFQDRDDDELAERCDPKPSGHPGDYHRDGMTLPARSAAVGAGMLVSVMMIAPCNQCGARNVVRLIPRN